MNPPSSTARKKYIAAQEITLKITEPPRPVIATNTTVKIYDSPTLPTGITKPTAIKIDENSENRGWDPTDPGPNNPWNHS
ncbi:hypothetical protein IKG64_03410 [Candidatus Saccharibacteria bacterium]|nr:hypothetical protein [Candidatus Saccharibacteria bacterium]